MSDFADTTESGLRRRKWKSGERAKVSIYHIFRSSFWDHDARKERQKVSDGDEQISEISQRSRQRRDGLAETELRAHLQADLGALLNTVRLDAALSLEDHPNIQRSVVNYGFRDLSSVPLADIRTPAVVNSIKQSLIDHEPRLLKESIEVTMTDGADEGTVDQRLSITITAEMMGDPVEIPLSFDADIDLGSGKLKMSKLRVQS